LTANSIAEDESSIVFNETYDSLWLKQENNIRLKEISIDNIIKSTIILLHSTLESGLFELCSLLEKEMQTTINISDINDSKGYINQSIVFLTKVIGLKNIKQLHDCYVPFNKLRNNIVHIEKKEEKIPEQFFKYYNIENKVIRFSDSELINEMIIVIRNLIESIELELDLIQGFPALIKKIGNIFWTLNQKNLEVECIDNVIVYKSIIYSEKYNFVRKLKITFKPASSSRNRIEISENDKIINDYNLFLCFERRLNYLKKVMKYYKNLIKGKRSFKLEVKIDKA